jgi:hypothetical protein
VPRTRLPVRQVRVHAVADDYRLEVSHRNLGRVLRMLEPS